jgi:HK97 family phage major capsid protein/HK97 family phage prohead protease
MAQRTEKMNNLETRAATLTIEEEGNQFVGIAANFQKYSLGEFNERIMPSAFADLSKYDVRALVNHDPNQLLARSKYGKGTLLLEATDDGLRYMFEAPNTQVGNDTKELVSRGDITGSSWGFVVKRDEWTMDDDGTPLRTIHEIAELRDVSLTSFPANPTTEVALRSMDKFITNHNSVPMEEKKNVPAPAVHKSEGEHRSFSLTKALREARTNSLTGLEAELSQEGYKEKRDLNLDVREDHAFHFPVGEGRTQSVTAGTQPGEGGELVETVKLNIIDKLWAGTPTLDRVTRFENLRGNVEWPADGAVPTLNFETEVADAADQTSTWGKKSASPHRAAIAMSVSNQLLRQDYSSGVQQRLLNQMSRASQVGLENAILNGDGLGANPTGIYTALAGSAVTIGAGLDYDTLVDLEKTLAGKDALFGNLAYVTHPDVTAFLKKSRVDAGSGILAVEYSDNLRETMTANGYPILSTTVSPVNTTPTPDEYGLLFGNLDDVALSFWSGVSVMTDPYTRMTESIVRLYLEFFCDVTVLRDDSFVISTDVQTGEG